MKVLMLATKYSREESSPYLTDELAREIASLGHEIHVLWVNWERNSKVSRERCCKNFVTLHEVSAVHINWGPNYWRRFVRWVLTPWRVAINAYQIQKLNNPDVFIAYSPLTALWLPVWLLTRGTKVRRYLVQWDFFPDAQQQDGALKSAKIARVLRWLENWLMNRFTVIGCMSPLNIEYMKNNYRIKNNIEVKHLPIWTSCPKYKIVSREIVRHKYGLPIDKPIFVFGGQFVTGRGIEEILAASEICSQGGEEFLVLFIGKGPLVECITEVVSRGASNIIILNNIPRREYLTLLSACDVGLVSTLRVAVPTFPSKSLDYIQVGLPILASVDPRSDFGDFIENNEIGIQVPAGNYLELAGGMRTILKTVHLNQKRGQIGFGKSFEILNKVFLVKNAALNVMGVVSDV